MKVNFKLEFTPSELKSVVEYSTATDTIIDSIKGVKPINIIDKIRMVLRRYIKRNISFNDKGIEYDVKVVFNKNKGIIVDANLNVDEKIANKIIEAYTDTAMYMVPLAELARVVYVQMVNRLDKLEKDLNDL